MKHKALWNTFLYLVLILLLNSALVLSFGFTEFELIVVNLFIAVIYSLGLKD